MGGTPKLSIRFQAWYPVKGLLSNTELALKYYPYDSIYLCDEYQSTEPFVAMAAIAMEFGMSVGTSCTFVSRNPLYLAQKFASVAELLPPDKDLVAGFGSGGASQLPVMLRHPAPIADTEEAVILLSRLLHGDELELSGFPRLGNMFGFNPEGKAKLLFPPEREVPVCLAAGGRRSSHVAGMHGDGVMLGLVHPMTCLSAMRLGLFEECLKVVDEARASSSDPGRSFKKVFIVYVSVSKDRRAARDLARRSLSYALPTFSPNFPQELSLLGISEEEVKQANLREAYVKALGAEEATSRVSEELLDKSTFFAAGSPDEVRRICLEVASFLKPAGFNEIILGGFLGPDLSEALQLIGTEIAPAVREALG
jgi:alkanesulfonate monooxygenase SsuD/methylene tetrahydromethanopterin reductase-like flavin-dependent oxidoreductase (luciferase family)